MSLYRFHVLGLPHLPTNREMRCCAYTQKVVKLCRMLRESGHEVLFYGGEGSDVACSSFTQVVSDAERVAEYGAYDHAKEFFKHGNDAVLRTFNSRAAEAVNACKRDTDFLLCPWGIYQKPVADACGLRRTVEPGIGYRGVFAPYQVYESHGHRARVYGMRGMEDGRWTDAVIPNYYDTDEFPAPENPSLDYYLFIGRLVFRKGIHIARDVTLRIGARLIVAGQGSLVNPVELLDMHDAHVEHVGSVGPQERAKLMGNAVAVFAASHYLEPFGGVNAEAQLCGCPVIASDWGAYPETVEQGVTGFRCRVFEEFVTAADAVRALDRQDIAARARALWSMEVIRHQYDEYWDMVDADVRYGWYGAEGRPGEIL